MARRILIITAVDAESKAVGHLSGTFVVTGGIGRTNAAASTMSALLSDGPFHWILNIGVAGACKDSGLSIGDVVVGSESVYMEEGLQTTDGFQTIEQMGFSLGKFDGNRVPADAWMLEQCKHIGTIGPIATVATCSGTDEFANQVTERTGAVAEAMEGAAVMHVANLMNTPAIEIRVISNTTGNRDEQEWNLQLALQKVSEVTEQVIQALWKTSE